MGTGLADGEWWLAAAASSDVDGGGVDLAKKRLVDGNLACDLASSANYDSSSLAWCKSPFIVSYL